jgi:hypothetical protein
MDTDMHLLWNHKAKLHTGTIHQIILPLLSPWVKIKRPCKFFFTFFSASMQQNNLMNCTGM